MCSYFPRRMRARWYLFDSSLINVHHTNKLKNKQPENTTRNGNFQATRVYSFLTIVKVFNYELEQLVFSLLVFSSEHSDIRFRFENKKNFLHRLTGRDEGVYILMICRWRTANIIGLKDVQICTGGSVQSSRYHFTSICVHDSRELKPVK